MSIAIIHVTKVTDAARRMAIARTTDMLLYIVCSIFHGKDMNVTTRPSILGGRDVSEMGEEHVWRGPRRLSTAAWPLYPDHAAFPQRMKEPYSYCCWQR